MKKVLVIVAIFMLVMTIPSLVIADGTGSQTETSTGSQTDSTTNTDTGQSTEPTVAETADTSPEDVLADDEPTPTDTVSEPTPTDTVSEPTPTDTVSEPTPTDTVSEPTPTDTVSGPTPTDTVSEPTPTDTGQATTDASPTETAASEYNSTPANDTSKSDSADKKEKPSKDSGNLEAGASASAVAESNSTDNTSAYVTTGANSTDDRVETFAYAEAQGDNITVTSTAYAEGPVVRGSGGSSATGEEESGASVQVVAKVLDNGYNSLTIISVAYGKGNAKGHAWAWALAEFIPDVTDTVKYHNQKRSFAGFLFGTNDVERYTYFKYKYINENNSKDVRYRAKYFMGIIAEDNGLNETEFENKFNIVVDKLDKDIRLVRLDKENNIVVISVKDDTYEIPVGEEKDIGGRVVKVLGIDGENVRIKVYMSALKSYKPKTVDTNVSTS